MLLSTDVVDVGAANYPPSCLRIWLVVVGTSGMPYASFVCFAYEYQHQYLNALRAVRHRACYPKVCSIVVYPLEPFSFHCHDSPFDLSQITGYEIVSVSV